MRARARAKRWNEEKEIVVNEMGWVIGTFRHMGEIWGMRTIKAGNEKPGHMAYAARETDRWNRWVEIAKSDFGKVTGMKGFQM